MNAQELVTLKSTQGKEISACIEAYNPQKQTVSVRVDGKGRVITFSMDRLDKQSKGIVETFHENDIVANLLNITLTRQPCGRGETQYAITLFNNSPRALESLEIHYTIPWNEEHVENVD
ncbi:MAG: hypothetical protein AAGF10_07515, partial [Verrucomicrobiota bacterium]